MSENHRELTMQEQEDFFSKGYFIRKNMFEKTEVQELLEAYDGLQSEAEKLQSTTVKENSQFVVENGRIDRIVWACGYAPILKKYARDLRLTLPSALLLQSLNITQLICQAHFKLPGDNVMFDWHQDSQHRGYGTPKWTDINQKGSFVQSLVALDPSPIESGPLYFIENTVPKGHLSLDLPQNQKLYIQKEKAVPVLLEPGDGVFFHPFAIHGSTPNASNRPRRVFINGFAYPGANQYSYPGCGLGESFSVPLSHGMASTAA